MTSIAHEPIFWSDLTWLMPVGHVVAGHIKPCLVSSLADPSTKRRSRATALRRNASPDLQIPEPSNTGPPGAWPKTVNTFRGGICAASKNAPQVVRGRFFCQSWTLGRRPNKGQNKVPTHRPKLLREPPRLLAEHILTHFRPCLHRFGPLFWFWP